MREIEAPPAISLGWWPRGNTEMGQGPHLPWFPRLHNSGALVDLVRGFPSTHGQARPSQRVSSASSHLGSLVSPLVLWKASIEKPCSAKSPACHRYFVHMHNINCNANTHSGVSSELYGSSLASLKAPKWPKYLLF